MQSSMVWRQSRALGGVPESICYQPKDANAPALLSIV